MADVTFSSIHVVSGQELGDTPQVFVQPAGKRASRPGETLLLFLDLPNAKAATYADVARALSDGYWRAPGGVTTALRLAIKLANDRLIELNRGLPPGQRAEGSLSCAVVNDESVVIAQAGPAIAYARAQNGAFERVTPEDDSALIGSSRIIEAYFTHFAWKSGDSFVLSGMRSLSGVDDNLVKACMGKGDARLAAGYLNANIKTGQMTGVAFSVNGAGSPLLSDAALTTPVTTLRGAQTSAPTATPRIAQSSAAPAREKADPGERSLRTQQALSSASAAASTMFSNAARSIQRSLGAFGAQLLPASPAPARQRSRGAVFGLAAAAILLPIVVALVVTVLYFQLSGEAEKQQLRNQAQAQVAAAKTSNTKGEWTKALTMISAFENKYPDEAATFVEDKRQAKGQLDQISKITRVTPASLVDFASNAPRRIAAASLGVYVLDNTSNSAEYYVLNVQRNGVTGKPVPLTPASTTPTNVDYNDLTWATTSGGRWRTEGALLFSKGALYEYSSATGQLGALSLPTDASSAIGQIASGELYNSAIYILDTGVGQIWRYSMQGGKLVKGDTYFRSPFKQLQDSIDIAIDGAVYLLQKNGTVLKYFNRQPDAFSMNISSLPEPMGKAIALAINGVDNKTGSVFIADSTNGAVWQFTKTGEFVRQYRAANDEFVNMLDMSLDPTSNTMYINTATKLYSFKVS
jgi:hypothetical protein